MASAQFEIDPGTGAFGATPQQATSAGVTVNLRLVSLAGVNPGMIEWSCEGTNRSSVATPTITPGGTPLGATASFAIPSGTNKAYLIQCKVNGGPPVTGDALTQYRGKVYVLNANSRQPVVANETTEGNATHGVFQVIDEVNNQTGAAGDATSLRGKVLDNTTVSAPATADVIAYDGTDYVATKTLTQTAIGTAQTIGIKLRNSTTATGGSPSQYSPTLALEGRHYSGSDKSWIGYVQATGQGVGFWYDDNGGGPHPLAAFGQGGELYLGTYDEVDILQSVLRLDNDGLIVGGGADDIRFQVDAANIAQVDAGGVNILGGLALDFSDGSTGEIKLQRRGTTLLESTSSTFLRGTSGVDFASQGRIYSGLDALSTIGGDDLTTAPNGTFVGVGTGTNTVRGFATYQINTATTGARVYLNKARGTPSSPSTVTSGDGVGRVEWRAYDGSAFITVGFLTATVQSRFGTIGGSLDAVEGNLQTEGPSFATNALGTSALKSPIAHTFYDNRTLSNATPTIALAVPILADTMTILKVHAVGRDQTSGDMASYVKEFRVERVGSGDPALRGTAYIDSTYEADATWDFTYAVNTTDDTVEFTITSDATNNVKWAVYVWELAIPFPA